MHPSAPRSSRSSVHSLAQSVTPIPSPSPSQSPSPSVVLPLTHQQQQQQQQQHIIYGPITTLQPCNAALHPPCIYPASTQRGVSNSSHMPSHGQGKSTKWHGKSKPPRNQYCHGQPTQPAHISYAGKPLVLYDQGQTVTPSATSSFLVSSSTFSHGQFPSDHYNNPGVTLVPQPYFKPPDVQTFCLVQDRQTAPQHNSYYNISATNTCSLQAVNSGPSFQLPNLTPYALAAYPNNQIPTPVPVQSAQIFQTAPVGLVFGPPPREKHAAITSSNLDSSAPSKSVKNKPPVVGNTKANVIPHLQGNEWPPSPASAPISSSTVVGTSTNTGAIASGSDVFEGCKSPQTATHKSSCVSTALKHSEDRYSDESSASFDFTIEAEKMVSALCNTASSNDLGGASGKDETRKTETSYFNGAGDNVANKGNWFADFGMDYSSNGTGGCRAVGTQTQPNQGFTQQLPELIRKTAYWGCSEAETILNSQKYQDPRQIRLSHISSVTRTAITKSSTCFPMYAGDRTFVHDLINSLLRITNGWLILDNYLNKQHYPNLTDKFDAELTRCFQGWEGSTYELLRNVIQTFLKLDEVNISNSTATSGLQNESHNGSFPGDVSLYTQSDIFDPVLGTSYQKCPDNNFLSSVSPLQPTQESAYAVHYTPHSSGLQNFRYFNPSQGQRETKLRSKWTITESLASAIDGTKSVPDVTVPHTEPGLGAGKFRAKISTSSAKGPSRQSLNAEFFDLRNKVMESNSEAGKQWNMNSECRKRPDFLNKTKPSGGLESLYRTNSSTGLAPLYSTKQPDTTHDLAGPSSSYLHGIEPIFNTNTTSGIEAGNFGRSSAGEESNYFRKFRGDMDCRSKSFRCGNENYAVKSLENENDPIYLRKSTTDQLELATVPRNKMTLLSQIEPSAKPETESKEMAANLSAWFASMRISNPILSASSVGNSGNRTLSESFKSQHHQESSRSVMDLTRQLQMDPNRQLQTLQNMQSIQSAPWNACNLINSRSNIQQVDEYDSSEDVRVYMKPGSYNVPKKRHQRRPNRRIDNSMGSKNPSSSASQNNHMSKDKTESAEVVAAIKLPFPAIPVLQTPSFSLENSPRILRRINSSSSQDFSQDIAWKAACASAEILLEALNVKDGEQSTAGVKEISSQIDSRPKCQDGDASSYEASEDDSGSTCKLSPPGVQSKESKINKTNVKTDSWLIRTLNNASIKQRREPELDSSESLNSSIHEDELAGENQSEKFNGSLRRSQEPRDEDQAVDLAEGISKATYSETVRRCASINGSKESCRSRPQKTTLASSCGTGNLIATKKSQRKESERSFLVHKSRKSTSKKAAKDVDIGQVEEGIAKPKPPKEDISRFPALKGHSKKKDSGIGTSGENGKNKNGDRGWSVWYSSRRRQSLSPMATNKLEIIHKTVWEMEEAEIFKYPPSSSMAVRSSAESIEDYYKIIKSPMFLDTIGYKLKNKIYHKVEHVIRDFRRIIFNSRIYHKNDSERMAHVEALSRKLDSLFDEHFTNWELENITGSPRDGNGSPVPSRYKLPATHKAQRSANVKKSPSVSTNVDNNSSVH